jgi:flavin reductase (DIM6/NTAB) family NADH-FMN oxidoreductase RutF
MRKDLANELKNGQQNGRDYTPNLRLKTMIRLHRRLSSGIVINTTCALTRLIAGQIECSPGHLVCMYVLHAAAPDLSAAKVIPFLSRSNNMVTAGMWKHLTTTVGLVSSGHDNGVNIMAAEWTYFLNKDPLYIAVGLSKRSVSRKLIKRSGEFSVTLCAESQAEAADFAGSFSGLDVDKSSSEAFTLRAPAVIATPWVEGGVAAFECVVRRVVRLPDYHLFIAEAVAAHIDSDRRPLVKHGPMYALGDPVEKTAVVAAAQALRQPGAGGPLLLRVAAAGRSPEPRSLRRITLVGKNDDELPLGEYSADEYGDLLVDVDLPPLVPGGALSSCRIRVECDGLKPGWARVSAQPELSAGEPAVS